MASGIVGSLKVLLGLDASEFVSGFTKAEQVSAKFAEQQKKNQAAIDRQVLGFQKQADALGRSAREQRLFELAQRGATAGQLKSADAALRQVEAHDKLISQSRILGRALGLAATIGGAGFVYMVKGAIDAADHLNDLSKKTGIAVTTLGGIGFAAKQAGGDLDSAAAAVGKLNKTMAAAMAGNTEAFEPFKALGISIQELQRNSPDQILTKIADKFASFEDGPNKAALALRLFGKAGADLIPLLNEGGESLRTQIEYYEKYSGVTAQVAADSDAFNDTIVKVKLLFDALFTTIASNLLPVMQSLADSFEEGKNKTGAFDLFAAGLARTLEALVVTARNVAYVFTTLGDTIGATVAIYGAVLKGDIAGAKAIGAAYKEVSEARRSALDRSDQRTFGVGVSRPGDQTEAESRRLGMTKLKMPKGKAPGLPDSGASGQAEAALKKRLDGELAMIRAAGEERKQVLEHQMRYDEMQHSVGLISLSKYFEDQKVLRAGALSSQLRQIDEEIALEEKRRRLLSKPADKEDATNKIKKSEAERASILRRFRENEQLELLKIDEATRQVNERYQDLVATVRELKGDKGGALDIRITQQVETARRTAVDAGQSTKVVDDLKFQLEAQKKLTLVQDDYNKMLGRTRDAEEDILLAARASGASEIETLRAVGQARGKALNQLGEYVIKARQLAQESGSEEAIKFADELSRAFKRASVEIDPLKDKVNELADEIGQAFDFTDAITGAKSFKDVLKDIDKQIAAIIIRETITKPIQEGISGFIKQNSSSSGVGSNLLDGIFGGAKNLFSGLFNGGLGGLFGGSSGGGFGSGLAASYSKAGGGWAPSNSFQRVNENGPELLDISGKQYLMMGSKGGNVLPNSAGGRNNVTTQNIYLQPPPGMDRRSSNQWLSDASRKLRSATDRGSS